MSGVTGTFRHISDYSCTFALFRNSVEYIRRFCSFILLPYNVEPSILALDVSTVLFTNVSNVTRTCMNAETITLADCLQCIHHVPCGCHFSTPGVYLPPHMENCHLSMDNDTHLPYTHVTNLAVLSHFFSEKDLGQFAADTLLNHPVHAILRNITLLDHNYSDTLAAIDRTRFQLSKAANLSISRQIAFRSMAE